jgi:hypothetical protein
MAVKIHRKFESLSELIKFAKGGTDMKDEDRASITHEDYDGTWANGADIKEAWKLLESGWQEGADQIKEVNTDLTAQSDGYAPLPTFEPSVMGEIVEPSSYFSGEPECFYEQQPTQCKVPVVKIGIPSSISCGAESQELINRGLAMLALINAIEQNRISTELWIVQHCTSGSSSLVYEIKVKSSDEPFDMDRLAFMCAHPAFFRRVIFSAKEHENKKDRQALGISRSGGYGQPKTYTSKDYDLLPDYDLGKFRSPDLANQWIIKNAKKVGIEVTL